MRPYGPRAYKEFFLKSPPRGGVCMTGKKITKAEIVDAVYEKTGINRKDIKVALDIALEKIRDALAEGAIIELRGFGTFELRIRKGRKKARNPKTGEAVSSNSHGIVAFRAGRDLKKDVLNLNKEDES